MQRTNADYSESLAQFPVAALYKLLARLYILDCMHDFKSCAIVKLYLKILGPEVNTNVFNGKSSADCMVSFIQLYNSREKTEVKKQNHVTECPFCTTDKILKF